MIQVILLSFREYFEAFLLITGFSLICWKYGVQRTKEIAFGSILAFLLTVSTTTYILLTGKNFLAEAQTDYLEGWLLLSSSILIAFFAFPFHRFIWKKIERNMPQVESRIVKQGRSFDWLLFLFIFLLVGKEGLEALLFTAGVSLSSSTNGIENVAGLVIGFSFASGLAFLIRVSSLYLKVEKIFSVMAFAVLLGMGTLFQQGIMEVFNLPYMLSDIFAGLYCLLVYVLFINRKEVSINT